MRSAFSRLAFSSLREESSLPPSFWMAWSLCKASSAVFSAMASCLDSDTTSASTCFFSISLIVWRFSRSRSSIMVLVCRSFCSFTVFSALTSRRRSTIGHLSAPTSVFTSSATSPATSGLAFFTASTASWSSSAPVPSIASSSWRFSSICSAKRMASWRTADAARSGTPPRLARTCSSSVIRSPRTDASCMVSSTASSSSWMRWSRSLPSSTIASSSLMRFERSTAAWRVADTRASSSAIRALCTRCGLP
mmetsp:Transcript_13400/g.39152  ORF Transcript_13400/g.39152 Transcript_13400/m.39152 type:complete len:250 (+) Transcript_13400:1883-2632(+)